MGTVGSYSGSGGKPGNDTRDAVTDWLEQLPSDPRPGQPQPDRPKLDSDALLSAIQLLRPRGRGAGGDGPGIGGGGGGGGSRRTGGGPRRSTSASARSAGRAAAAAYAFATGDAAALARLGLDYAELAALGDPVEVVRRIVEAACGPRTDSSIEDHERRLVAAELAEWVIAEGENGSLPSPEEIARRTIATIIAEAILVETASEATQHDQGALVEEEIRDAAEALAEKATLSIDGATEEEFYAAIEAGIETLRAIQARGT
jgi:hypothetical protein